MCFNYLFILSFVCILMCSFHSPHHPPLPLFLMYHFVVVDITGDGLDRILVIDFVFEV